MTCKDCIYYEDMCKEYLAECVEHGEADRFFNPCVKFKNKADFVEVVRCGQCKYARELDKHCEINRNSYRHCALCRGEETINVWHKYKKYYKDYSIVALDDYCNEGERSDT